MAGFYVYANGVLADSVVIQNPDLGDTDSLNFTRINRVTQGGQLVVFSDVQWPRFERLKLPFSYLNQIDAYKLKRLIHFWFGVNIYYLDYEGRYWYGFFVTSEVEITESGISNFTMSIDFEGWPSAAPPV